MDRAALDTAIEASLSALPLFDDLDADERDILASVLTPIVAERNEPVCREGDPGRACFFLVTGRVAVHKHVPGASDKVLAELGPGEVFGHLSLVDPGRRTATCRATTRSRVLRLDREDFDRLFQAHSPFAFKFQELIARSAVETLRSANRRLHILMTAQRSEAATTGPQPALDEVRVILARGDAGRLYQRRNF